LRSHLELAAIYAVSVGSVGAGVVKRVVRPMLRLLR